MPGVLKSDGSSSFGQFLDFSRKKTADTVKQASRTDETCVIAERERNTAFKQAVRAK
jgi:hypothetical protein